MRNIFKGVGRNARILGFVSFLNDSASEMIFPYFPTFVTKVLGGSVPILGVIEGIADSASSLLKLLSGVISDRLRKRKIFIIVGYALAVIGRFLIPFTTHAIQLIPVRLLDRTGKGLRAAPRDAIIAAETPVGLRGRVFGFQRGMDHLGAATGPLLALLVLFFLRSAASPDPTGAMLRSLFLFAAIPGALVLLALIFLKEETRSESATGKSRSEPSRGSSGGIQSDRLPKPICYLCAILFLFSLGKASDAFLILKAQESGVTIGLIALLWIVHHISKAILAYPLGILSDRIGKVSSLILGWTANSVIYLAFALFTGIPAAFAIFIFYGIYYGLTEGPERALMSEFVTEGLLGRALGLYHFTIGIAVLPANLIFGFLWDHFSSDYPFYLGASLSLLSALLLTFFSVIIRRSKR